MSMRKFEDLIDENTITLLCSAPTVATGRIDPVYRMAGLARNKSIGCHVDQSMGMLTPFLGAAGYQGHKTDFSVKGVTSINVCLSKYGKCPAGSAVLLFRTKELRRYQYFGGLDWCGGMYLAPGLCGSRTSATNVAAWSRFLLLGKKGYEKQASEIVSLAHSYWNILKNNFKEEIKLVESEKERVLNVVVF